MTGKIIINGISDAEKAAKEILEHIQATRATAHLLSGYYDTPRQDDGLTLLGMTARRTRDDH